MLYRLYAVALLLFFPVFTPIAQAGAFGRLPDVLICSVSDPLNEQRWDRLVFYVSARLEDGGLLYKSLTSNPVLITVDAKGAIDAPNLKDCDGATVGDLKEQGRAYDFR